MLNLNLDNRDPNQLLTLSLVSFIGCIGLSTFMFLPIFVGAQVDYLHYGVDSVGWVSAISLAGLALMTLITSLKAKHWPLAKMATYGLLTMIVFDTLTIFFQSITVFSVLRFFSGMGGGAIIAAVAAAIARLPHSDKGFGIYTSFQFILPAIAFYEFPILLPKIGYEGMLEIFIALEISALLIVPVLANYKLPITNSDGKSSTDVFEIDLIRQKPGLLSILGITIYGAANAVIWTYSERMGLNSGLTSEGTGTVLAVVNILGIGGALLVVWLQDKLGHIKPLAAGISLQIISMLILIGFESEMGYIIGMCIFTVAWAFSWPYFFSIQASIDPTGTVAAAGMFGNIVGNSIGPAMAAMVIAGGDYVSASWMACALFIASLLPMFVISRKH